MPQKFTMVLLVDDQALVAEAVRRMLANLDDTKAAIAARLDAFERELLTCAKG